MRGKRTSEHFERESLAEVQLLVIFHFWLQITIFIFGAGIIIINYCQLFIQLQRIAKTFFFFFFSFPENDSCGTRNIKIRTSFNTVGITLSKGWWGKLQAPGKKKNMGTLLLAVEAVLLQLRDSQKYVCSPHRQPLNIPAVCVPI